MSTRSTLRASLPDALTLLAFAGVVVIAGGNLVAVRLSTEKVSVFFGAGIRFAVAGVLLLLVAFVFRVPTPTRSELVGTVLYGLLAFGGSMALGYWALQELPAGVGGVILAAVPILTILLARFQGLESLHLRGLVGGALTIVGIWVLLSGSIAAKIPLGSAAAMAGGALCFAEAGIVIKRFPPCHPMASNGLAMAIGSTILLAISGASRESWSLPVSWSAWLLLGYMVLIGSIGLFALYLFVLRGWTASGASYQFVLIPFVSTLLGAGLLDEAIDPRFILGGLIVLVGVFVGALASGSKARSTPEQEAQAQRCATT